MSAPVTKCRDGVDGGVHQFRLVGVHLGVDEDFDDVTSAVAVPVAGGAVNADTRQPFKPPFSRWQRAVWDCLNFAQGAGLAEGELEQKASDEGRPRTRESVRRAVQTLEAKGQLARVQGRLFLPQHLS